MFYSHIVLIERAKEDYFRIIGWRRFRIELPGVFGSCTLSLLKAFDSDDHAAAGVCHADCVDK